MNCNSCKELSGEFLSNSLPAGISESIASHLETCSSCSEFYKLEKQIELLITAEMKAEPNPFLSARIMSAIDSDEPVSDLRKRGYPVLRPALLTISMAAAIFAGIAIGKLLERGSRGEKLPVEMALIDDSVMESLPNLSND